MSFHGNIIWIRNFFIANSVFPNKNIINNLKDAGKYSLYF